MSKVLYLLFATLTLWTNNVYGESEELENPLVYTTNGTIRGYRRSVESGELVDIFEGIPYAEPPVGYLRFRRPQPLKQNWTDVYNARGYRTACIQPLTLYPDNNVPETTHQSEDCLFLTLYRPSNVSSQPRPIMIWLHGGGFETGTAFSIAYDARYIVTIGDVIVVTINYRLGAFGFLFGDTEDTEGNTGLYDAVAALKWIKTNAAAFGGDPNSICLFGESAGSMGLSGMILSPHASGLFNRAVMQSGATNSYLGSENKTEALRKTHSLARKLNCPLDDKRSLVDCLRLAPAEAILNATENARSDGESFEPVWGTPFLPMKPAEALLSGSFDHSIDLMFGIVSEEGALFVESIFPLQLDPNLKNVTITVPQARTMIMFMYQLFHESYGNEVADFYLKGLTDDDKDAIRQAVGYAFGDYHQACPTILFGRQYALHSAANVFSFRVARPPKVSVFPNCHGWMGVCHGDDVVFIYGFPIRLRGTVYDELDYQQSVDMIKAWTNFARHGRPGKVAGVEWIQALEKREGYAGHVQHMSLDSTNYTMIYKFFQHSCEGFWAHKLLKI